MTLDTTPLWTTGDKAPSFPALSRDMTVDVVVIGGGITGVTAAYLLKRVGLSVALVERGRCGEGETAHTTAHLAAVTDRSFAELVGTFGQDRAEAAWHAGYGAIAEIEAIVRRERIECGFRRAPGYLHTSLAGGTDDEIARLKEEAAALSQAGFDAAYFPAIPGLSRPGVRFGDQAIFHPLRYLHTLVGRIPGKGSHVFEQSPVESVNDDPLSVAVGSHRISTKFVVMATHVPLMGKTGFLSATLLQTDLYPYSTYAVAATIGRHQLPEALFWDLAGPYHYLRVDSGPAHDRVIFGGADHKTGQADDTRDNFGEIERKLLELVPDAVVTHRWSGQVIETRDGLPYIGETSPKQFVATGFSGNGITFGTAGAMMARDAVTGAANPWRELFDVRRIRVAKGLATYVSENKDYPYYMIRDRFQGDKDADLSSLRRGEGRTIEIDGKHVAAYRTDEGEITAVSAYCTHMGCVVSWNQAEASWDCPCHGSRFTATGKVMGGPAEEPLSPLTSEGKPSAPAVSR